MEVSETVHLSLSRLKDMLWMVTQARRAHGARRILFTVASFRIWRGSQIYVAWDPTLYITTNNMGPLAEPKRGVQLRYSGLRIEGTAGSPSSTASLTW